MFGRFWQSPWARTCLCDPHVSTATRRTWFHTRAFNCKCSLHVQIYCDSLDQITPCAVKRQVRMPTSEDLEDMGPTLQASSRTSSIRVFDQLEGFTDAEDDMKVRSKVSKWCGLQAAQARDSAKSYTAMDWLALVLPCLSWIKKYSVRCLPLRTLSCAQHFCRV